MTVELITCTPAPEFTVALAMRRCTSTGSLDDILKELREKGPTYWKHLIERAHREKSKDVFEHVQFSFHVKPFSLAASLQLFRHRFLCRDVSPDQLSQRFSQAATQGGFITPPSIQACPECAMLYSAHFEASQALFHTIRSHGHPKEDARYVLPEGTASALMVSMNARAMLDVAWLRVAKEAQWEVRDAIREMVLLAAKEAPTIMQPAVEWEKALHPEDVTQTKEK